MRKLASVRQILALEPIVGADFIERATVDGWKVVEVHPDKVPEDRLPDSHRDIKRHRRNTGDALRK